MNQKQHQQADENLHRADDEYKEAKMRLKFLQQCRAIQLAVNDAWKAKVSMDDFNQRLIVLGLGESTIKALMVFDGDCIPFDARTLRDSQQHIDDASAIAQSLQRQKQTIEGLHEKPAVQALGNKIAIGYIGG